MVFCFAVINSVAAITLKTIMPEQSFLGSTSLKWPWLTILDGDLKMAYNLQYGKVLSIGFCSRFLISNDFLPRNGKTQLIPFLA